MSELAELLEGGNCSDIVEGKIKGKIEIDSQRHEIDSQRHEEDDKGMVKRVKIKDKDRAEKVTPIEYLSVTGEVPKLDQIQVLKPENLTADDAVKFIEAGCTRKHLADLYGMSVGKLYSLLTQFGLHTPKRKVVDKSVDIPVDTVESKPGPKPVPEPVPEIMADALEPNITWLDPVESLPKITINGRNEISLNCAAVIIAPARYQQGCKARIGVDTTQNTLIIQPVAETEEGYTFRQRGWLLKVSSKWVKEGLIKAGMDIPAAFEVSWNNDLQAWVGRLIREEEVV